MQTIWLSPTNFVTGDPTLRVSYPFVSHPSTIVSCTAPGDLKWVSLGLRVPPDAQIEEVIIYYEVSNARSFISQTRLAEMTTPDHATVVHDDPTRLTSTAPATYRSAVSGLVAPGAVTLELRLNFQNTSDEILLGAVGVKIQAPAGRCVISIADLKALRAGAFHCVQLLGYYAPGDGGGGEFYWDATSSETDNGGTIIVPASNPATGRWKRIYGGPLNVRWFGASPNNVNNQMYIAWAIAVLGAAGGTVYFPAGFYKIASALDLSNKLGISLLGEGAPLELNNYLSTTLIYTGHDGSLITGHGVTGLEIANISLVYSDQSYSGIFIDFNGTGQPITSVGIHIHDCHIGGMSTSSKNATKLLDLELALDVTVEKCFISNAASGIVGSSISYINSNNIVIRNNWFDAVFGTVAILGGGTNWVITENVFEPASSTQGNAVKTTAQGINGLVFSHNWLGDAEGGTWVDLTDGPVNGGEIRGNTFQGTGTSTSINLGQANGIEIGGSSFRTITGIIGQNATNINVGANYWNVLTKYSGCPTSSQFMGGVRKLGSRYPGHTPGSTPAA